MLQGNVTSRMCRSSGNWSGTLPSCEPLNCPNRTGAVLDGSHRVPPCPLQYQSQCTAFCDKGFTGNNITYMCSLRNNPVRVAWILIDGRGTMCERGML